MHPFAAAGEQVRGGQLRGAETEVGAGVCTGMCAARACEFTRGEKRPDTPLGIACPRTQGWVSRSRARLFQGPSSRLFCAGTHSWVC